MPEDRPNPAVIHVVRTLHASTQMFVTSSNVLQQAVQLSPLPLAQCHQPVKPKTFARKALSALFVDKTASRPTTLLARHTQAVVLVKRAPKTRVPQISACQSPALHHKLARIKVFVFLAALILLALEITAHRATVQFVLITLVAKRAKLVQSRIAHREAARLLFALHGHHPHHHPLAPARIFAKNLVRAQAVELVALRMIA